MGGLASDMLCGVRIGGKVAKEGGGGAPQILAPFKRPRRFGGRRSRNRDPHRVIFGRGQWTASDPAAVVGGPSDGAGGSMVGSGGLGSANFSTAASRAARISSVLAASNDEWMVDIVD